VVTVAGSSSALPGTETGTAKVTPFAEYPGKGRATGGVRCHRLLKGEDGLMLAWAGPAPALAAAPSGVPVSLPAPDSRRDGSGTPLPQPVRTAASSTSPPWRGAPARTTACSRSERSVGHRPPRHPRTPLFLAVLSSSSI
jgi:DNA gyrase subunit A